MKTKLRILASLFSGTLAMATHAGSFYIGIPLGVETMRSSDINGSLASEGIESIGDATSSSYGGGFGYEWDSGFRFGIKGSRSQVLDESEGAVFAEYSITRGGLNAEYPIISSAMSYLDLGLTLGGAISRFTVVGNVLTGVAQKLDAYVEPSLSFKYGGKSTKFFFTVSYPILADGEFKNFGNSGINDLSGPGPSAVLGFLIYLN